MNSQPKTIHLSIVFCYASTHSWLCGELLFSTCPWPFVEKVVWRHEARMGSRPDTSCKRIGVQEKPNYHQQSKYLISIQSCLHILSFRNKYSRVLLYRFTADSTELTMVPFLKAIPEDKIVNLLVNEAERLCEMSEFYSPTTSSLSHYLGRCIPLAYAHHRMSSDEYSPNREVHTCVELYQLIFHCRCNKWAQTYFWGCVKFQSTDYFDENWHS